LLSWLTYRAPGRFGLQPPVWVILLAGFILLIAYDLLRIR